MKQYSKNFNDFMFEKNLTHFQTLDWESDKDGAKNADFDSESDPRIIFYVAYDEKIKEYVTSYVSKTYPDYVDDEKKKLYLAGIEDPFGKYDIVEQFSSWDLAVKYFKKLTGILKPEVFKIK
jgi:hypothetical protein